jgi:hypothetical protein
VRGPLTADGRYDPQTSIKRRRSSSQAGPDSIG